MYDQFGHAAFDGSAGAQGAGQGFNGFQGFDGNGGYHEFHFEGGNMDDLFGDLFGDLFHGKGGRKGSRRSSSQSGNRYGSGQGFGSGFYQNGFGGFADGGYDDDGFYGGFGGAQAKGANLRAEVSVSFDEAAFGCDKVIRLQREDGSIQSLQVHIPAGIESGKTIRLRGKGAPGAGGTEAGDLLLKVNVGQKPGFERKGMDVYSVVSIPFTTAVFGGEVTVPTISGSVICKIKEGTQSGSRIRLRGKGIVSMSDPNVHGDQYVTVQIQVPTNLSREAKQKLKEYEEACGQHGRRKNHNSAA
ncbi:MAG TPA: molecular chaperone DnaJ [Candidatus Eisenbergiella merdipullorum]|uniref:Molecular chaperone DnaJ n=1 Tax=Candidatus Eisenbergiella merdipullorum TaxID=2838553 RepID=A0A9D2I5M5_9FIRM|nr:molecular chaperone DnaJ [Candidatus Eisenbergiella merdipullorum]